MLLAIRDRRQQRSACRTYSVGIRGMSRMTRGGVLKRGNSFTDIERIKYVYELIRLDVR